MIKLLGSKRRVLPRLFSFVGELHDVRSIVDLFSGTARVGHVFKARGYHVTVNDHLIFAIMLARCWRGIPESVSTDDVRWTMV